MGPNCAVYGAKLCCVWGRTAFLTHRVTVFCSELCIWPQNLPGSVRCHMKELESMSGYNCDIRTKWRAVQVIPGSGVTANVRLSAEHNVAGFLLFVTTALSTRLRYERKANISPVL
ncbi:hypothetical protein J6590_040852 [Homalodisca vitripennis]|nr:hypothetical protein J6590_040852 [Homalodisca vitripennis]